MKGFIRNRARLVAYTSAMGLFVFVALLAFPVVETSEEATAATGTALPSTTTLTLSSTNDNAFVNVVPNATQGTFSASDANGTAGFSVTTNNFTGYTLFISSSDDAGKLENYTHDYIESISSNLTETDFSAAGNTSYNNKWGFKPNKYVNNNTVVDNTGSNSVFLPSPTTTPTVLNTTTSANAVDDDYTLALGIRANMLLPSGVYSKTLNLVALANAAPYTVSFNQNTADTVTNMPTSLGGSTSTTSISIPNTTPVRANYTFMGWCDRKDVINECPTGGHTFQPGGSYGIDQTDDNTSVTLYAMWQPNFYMQEVAMWGQSLAIGDSVQAVDRRDGKIYWVTKEETDPANPRAEIDSTTGKAYQIWMTQNLDYDLDTNTALTPDTSDVTTSWTPSRSTVTDVANWTEDYNGPSSYNPGIIYYYSSDSNENDVTYNSLEACSGANHTAEECAHYSAGNYYNWSSAVANNDTSLMMTSTDHTFLPDSICPAGWRLPVGLTSQTEYSDFGYLYSSNGVTPEGTYGEWQENVGFGTNGFVKYRTDPLWLTRAGRIGPTGGSPDRPAIGSNYWSGTVMHTYRAYYSAVYSDVIYPAYDNHRTYGFSVRCIARNTMQNSSTDNIVAFTSHSINETTKLSDTRDGKTYTVSVIPDGRIWMTTNLDLAGGTTITSADSNVANNYTLPDSSDSGFSSDSAENLYNSDSIVCSTSGPCYSYYTYPTATAGTNPSSGNAEYDICPKGWRLPTKMEMDRLMMVYNSSTIMHDSLWHGSVGGGFFNSTLNNNGVIGAYWTSTAQDSSNAYRLDFSLQSASVISVQERRKAGGDSIRCVKKATVSDVEDMQDFAGLSASERQAKLDSMKTNIQYEMEDVRDGKTYTVARLPNGLLWMTQNLDIAGGTTLTPATSNVSSNYTLPASNPSYFNDNSTAYVYNSNNTDCSASTPCYSYYSFVAATAGTNNSTGGALYDICPKGWRLPVNSEYNYILSQYANSDALKGAPFYGTFNGNLKENTFVYGGTVSYYWSSIGYNDQTAYSYIFNNSNETGQVTNSNKYHGRGVRCVLSNYTTSNLTYLQDFNSLTPLARKDVIGSMEIGEQYTLMDRRDNQEYTISRLSDGTVWMTKNLNLAGGTALYSETSNVPDGYPASGGTPYYTLPASSSSGFNTTSADDVYNSNSITCSNDSPCYSYYNYFAATANTNPSANDAVYDICPKGWRLPVRSEQNSLMSLYSTDADLTNGPWNGVYAGRYTNSTFDNGGLYGRYWSATAYDSSYAYGIGYNNAGVNTNYDGKNRGISVRCVLNTTLQDTTVDMLGDLIPDAGDTVVLSDKRDGEKYTIGRLADGNVWMLENLRLGKDSTIALTAYNTNITTAWTLPASINDGTFNSLTTAQINIDSKNTTTTNDSISGKTGVYYNFCAASAGTICTNDNTANTVADVCPRGWRMPTGGASGEYQGLYDSYENNLSALNNAFRIIYSGYYFTGGNYAGTYHNSWSSTYASTGKMYGLNITSAGYLNQNENDRNYGYTIRCVKSH